MSWLVKALELAIVALLLGLDRNLLGTFLWAVPALASLTINIFLIAVFARVILSWVRPDPYHPVAGLLDSLTAPLLRPAQRLMPPVGGLDLSPVVVMIGLVLVEMLLIPPLKYLSGSPF